MVPKVSVLMSVYNGARYVRTAIESVLDQRFTDFEFILIDDGSTDETAGILSEYAQREQRILLLRNETNIGLTKSLNKGLQISQGAFIARHDADDIALPQRLSQQVAYLETRPDVVLVSCNLDVIGEDGRCLVRQERVGDPDLVAWYLLFYNHLGGHSQVMYRRKPVVNLGGYSETYRYSQDYELWSRLVKVGDIVVLPTILQQWRTHSEGISKKSYPEQRRYSLSTSQRNLVQCTGASFSLDLVADLREFWGERGFPDSSCAGDIQAALSQIYSGFVAQRVQQDVPDPELARKLRSLIGRQFFLWGLSLDARQQLRPKLELARYAFAWHPYGGLEATVQACKLRLARAKVPSSSH